MRRRPGVTVRTASRRTTCAAAALTSMVWMTRPFSRRRTSSMAIQVGASTMASNCTSPPGVSGAVMPPRPVPSAAWKRTKGPQETTIWRARTGATRFWSSARSVAAST